MNRPQPLPATAQRRGAILIVVLAMLALFAVIGLAFVFYADSEANIARLYKDAQSNASVIPPDGTAALQQYLSTLIYDVQDTGNGATGTPNLINAGRGHSLARSIYGYTGTPGASTIAFNGVGQFDDSNPPSPAKSPYPAGMNRFQIVNHTFNNLFNYVVDPERTGTRATPTSAPTGTYVGKHAGYTYPDANNLYLASIDPRTGEVLVPSYFRPWQFPNTAASPNSAANQLAQALAPTNPLWLNSPAANTTGRLRLLRPRPADQGPGFPFVPQNADMTFTGDVQNLIGGNTSDMVNTPPKTYGVQRNDSLWLDIGMPAFTWNGQLIKAMVAPLVVDLDGRVNLSVAGNQVGTGKANASAAGYGPWEINPAKLLPTADAQAIVNSRLNSAAPQPQNGSYYQSAGKPNHYFLPPIASGAAAQPLPAYGMVNWSGNVPAATSPSQFTLPNGTSLLGNPTYGTTFGNNATDGQATNHYSLFAANEWQTASGSPHTFPLSDTRRLTDRYADSYGSYFQLSLAPLSTTLLGSNPPQRTDAGDPLRMTTTTFSAGLNVPMLPPMMLDYSKLPNVLQFVTPSAAAGMIVAPEGTILHPEIATLPSVLTGLELQPPATAPTTSDVDVANRIWANRMAILGGVDLNRKLTDYRADTTQALSAWNVSSANYMQAWADRHNLARDIFIRLVIATGAMASVDVTNASTLGNVKILPTAADGVRYEALRYLAQLAVNIVDQIDGDDISTIFVWNPAQDIGGGVNVLTTVTPAMLQGNGTTGTAFQAILSNPAYIQSGVVFGTEKPRLLVNEVYSEYTNDPHDTFSPTNKPKTSKPPTLPIHVRFWIELLNPGVDPYPGVPAANKGPLGDGSVQLLYDLSDAPPSPPKGSLAFSSAFSPYQVQVVRSGKNSAFGPTDLQETTNSKGDLFPLSSSTNFPDIQIDFGSFSSKDSPLTGAAAAALRKVVPNQGQYAVGANNGFVVLAPNTADINPTNPPPTTPAVTAVSSDPASALTAGVIRGNPIDTTILPSPTQKPQNTLAYLYTLPNTSNLQLSTNPNTWLPPLHEQYVLLRRLANPYLPPNDLIAANNPGGVAYNTALPANPYITVDFMSYVPSMDAVYMASDTTAPTGRQAKPTGTPTPPDKGYDPMTPNDPNEQRFAIGRVQPMAGFFAPTNVAPILPIALPNATTTPPTTSPAFPASSILIQKPTSPLGGQVNHTLGRHNGIDSNTVTSGGLPSNPAETIVAPFDWLVHFDRPLSNPLELLHVSVRKPHELTQLFVPYKQPNALKPNHTANWLTPISGTPGTKTSGLYRALELLRVKPWDYGTPMGGKVYGRINLNAVQDVSSTGTPPSVFSALLDAQGGNNLFSAGDVSTISNALLKSRNPYASTYLSVTLPDNATTVQSYVPGQTVIEGAAVGTGDLPFRSLGFPQQSTTPPAPPPPPQVLGNGLRDTILRATSATTTPLAWVTGKDSNNNGPHPYLQSEAARKMFNNTTTVSNTFAVWVTVGFFQVTNSSFSEGSGITRAQMGPEVFLNVPGDLRQQYFALVDRTNLTIDPNDTAFQTQGPRPFFTDLQDNANVGDTTIVVFANSGNNSSITLYADGQTTKIPSITKTLYVGTGPIPSAVVGTGVTPPGWATNREKVTVQSVTNFDKTTGRATLTISPALAYAHPAGTLVTNAVPGNPGPQPNFDYTNPTYQSVVPYVTRIK